jgi:8-oxo-dGTP pyrophosphatase MutT (NUDIX family)
MRIVLPPPLAERARAVRAGTEPAAPLRPAATVVLLRDVDGLEVYLQHRHRRLSFAGGVYAFPGGRVDPADARAADASLGLPAQEWARRFESSVDEARAHVAAVLRELEEETGVAMDGHALVGWSRWVTPRFERRRFDTWFFAAALPGGQEPRVATSESHAGRWMHPLDALRALDRAEMAMLPPTWWTLRELAERGTLARALADPPAMRRHTVGWTTDGEDVVMALPGDPAYPGDDPLEGT